MPLSGGYWRAKEVSTQVRDVLCGLPPADIKTEALVCLLRHYHTSGMSRECDAVALQIQERAATRVMHWTRRYLPRSEPCHREQCAEAAMEQMWAGLFSNSPGNEFWEIAFWLCLKRRFINALVTFRRISANELSLITHEAYDDCNYIDLAPDRSIPNTLARLMMQEALAGVPVRCLRVLADCMDGREQAEIAAEFEVTSRTIRNWITEAKKIVRAYYE